VAEDGKDYFPNDIEPPSQEQVQPRRRRLSRLLFLALALSFCVFVSARCFIEKKQAPKKFV